MTEERKRVIDLASIVNAEAIYGRPLLDEVAAVTAQLEVMKGEIRSFLERAAGAARACSLAEERVYPVEGRIPGLEENLDLHDGLGQVLQGAAGTAMLSKVAGEAGLHGAIFEPDFEPEPFVPGGRS